MSPENLENISDFEGCGLTIVAYEKESVAEVKRKFLQITTLNYKRRSLYSLEV